MYSGNNKYMYVFPGYSPIIQTSFTSIPWLVPPKMMVISRAYLHMVSHTRRSPCKFHDMFRNMLMNPTKTKLMLFGTHQVIKKLDRLEIEINGTEFEYVSTYLGIYLDSILNFKKHLNMTLVSARHKLFVLKKIRPFIDKETSLLIFKTMVLPKLEYGYVTAMHGNTNLRVRLQSLQNYGPKMCLYLDRRTDTEEVHRLAKLNTLQDRANAQYC